jgi:hypothetical protein
MVQLFLLIIPPTEQTLVYGLSETILRLLEIQVQLVVISAYFFALVFGELV